MLELTEDQKKLLASSIQQEPVVEQRTQEWFDQRKGKLTSSEIHKILGKGRSKEEIFGDTAKSYLMSKVSEQLGGFVPPLSNNALDHGTEAEPAAISFYEKKYGLEVVDAPFVAYNDFYGGSADGFVGDDGLIEVKCPYVSANHFSYFLIKSNEDFKRIKSEYYWQVLSNLVVTNRQWADFITFDYRVQPEYIMGVHRVERKDCEEDIKFLLERVDLAVNYMNDLKDRLKNR
jgi:putative phage-type endonuclease